MKKKVLCTALAAMMRMTTTVSAEPWWLSKYPVTFDNELGIVGNVRLTFASDGGNFIRPMTKRYGESINLESDTDEIGMIYEDDYEEVSI